MRKRTRSSGNGGSRTRTEEHLGLGRRRNTLAMERGKDDHGSRDNVRPSAGDSRHAGKGRSSASRRHCGTTGADARGGDYGKRTRGRSEKHSGGRRVSANSARTPSCHSTCRTSTRSTGSAAARSTRRSRTARPTLAQRGVGERTSGPAHTTIHTDGRGRTAACRAGDGRDQRVAGG